VSVPPDLTLDRLIDEYVLGRGFRGFPVVENGRALGVISIDQLAAVPAEARRTRHVRDLMTPLDSTNCVAPDMPLLEALAQMGRSRAARLLVLRPGSNERVGLLTQSGLTRFVELRHALGAADS